LTKLLQAISPIQDYEYYAAALRKLPTKLNFPEQGIKRLTALKEQLVPRESELALLNEQIKQVEKKLQSLHEQTIADKVFRRLRQIAQQEAVFAEKEQLIAEEATEIVQDEVNLRQQLAQLSISLSVVDLDDLQFPFQTLDYWQSLNKEQEQLMLAE